jgi:hypothetical protein
MWEAHSATDLVGECGLKTSLRNEVQKRHLPGACRKVGTSLSPRNRVGPLDFGYSGDHASYGGGGSRYGGSVYTSSGPGQVMVARRQP